MQQSNVYFEFPASTLSTQSVTVVWSSLQAVHDIGGKIFFSSQLGFEADLAWADWNRAERKKKKTSQLLVVMMLKSNFSLLTGNSKTKERERKKRQLD